MPELDSERRLPEMFTAIRRLAVVACGVLCFASIALAQPAGGTTNTAPSKPAPKPSSSSKPPVRAPSTHTAPASSRPANQTNSSPASIDGKWWTSGNDFGASEVIFTQSGSRVSGEIHYANGGTGTLTGTVNGKRVQFTFTDSTGRSGSGWLEQSWNNFLGGPWHNAQVRDGSWTMMRVEGKWCLGGSRTRIRTVTHNARGEVTETDEYGEANEGNLNGPYLSLEADGIRIKGDMDFRANRMNWSSGFFWTWCGRN